MHPRKKPSSPSLPTPVDSVKHKDNHGFGRWAFLEIVAPWDAKNTIRKFIQGEKVDGIGPIFSGE